MTVKRTTPLRSVRTVVAGATLTTIALLSAGGVAVAGADADYPPLKDLSPPEVDVDANSPESASPAGAVAAGALPATGSGVDSTVMIAGSALLAGIGLAGISGLSRRRREAADAT